MKEIEEARVPMPVWYVSGPYTAPTLAEAERNAQRAEDAGIMLRRRGYAVIVPHRNGGKPDGEMSYEFCLREDLEILTRCDGIYMLSGWEQSLGAVREHDQAEESGIDIEYEP